MMELPAWWIWVSATFFLTNILVYAAFIYALLALKRALDESKPKIEALNQRAHHLADRVEAVSLRVEEVAKQTKTTVDSLSSRANGVVSSAELVAVTATKQFERFSPVVVGVLTALRLAKAVSDMRRGGAPKPAPSGKKAKGSGFLDFFHRG